MDGREPGNMVIGPSSYGAGATNSSIATENWTGMMHELQISYSSMCRFKQVDVAGSLYQGDDLSGNAPMKKMRGRPDGTNSLASTPSSDSGYSKSPGSDPTAKHLGTSGIGFTHVIFVEVGEDIASKIMAFSQLGPRAILFYQQMASSLVEKLLIRDLTRSHLDLDRVLFCLQKIMELISEAVGRVAHLLDPTVAFLVVQLLECLSQQPPVQVMQGSFIAGVKKPKPDPGGTSSESPDDPHIPANDFVRHLRAAFPCLILPLSATDTRYEINDMKLMTLAFR